MEEKTNNLILKDIFSVSFKKAKTQIFNFFIVMLCFIVLSMIDPSGQKNADMKVLRSLVSFVGSIYLSISLFGAVLKMVDGEEIKLKDFFVWPDNGFKMLFTDIVSKLAVIPFIVGAIVIGALVGFGMNGIFGIVVAVIGLVISIPLAVFLSVKLSLSKYFALDTGSGVVDSIKTSYKVTKGHFWDVFFFGIMSTLVVFLGLIALVVGLLWAIPTVAIAQIVLYRYFNPKKQNLPEIQPVELPANTPVGESI